jgi:hypothetical protein
VVLEKHGHGSTGTNRAVADLVRVEAKNVVSAKQGPGAAEQEFGKLVCKIQGWGNGAEEGVGGPPRDGAQDTLDSANEAVDGAEEGVLGPFLGAAVHFDTILLVFKGQCDPMGAAGECGVRVGEDMEPSVAKHNVF